MRSIFALLVVCCLLVGTPAFGTDGTMTVMGVHAVHFESEWAEIMGTIQERGRYNNRLIAKLEQRVDSLLGMIELRGDTAAKVSVGGTAPLWEKVSRRKRKVRGATTTIRILIRDMRRYEEIMEMLETSASGKVSVTRHGLFPDSSRQSQLIQWAIDDAERQAVTTADRLGISLGAPLEIDVNPSPQELRRRSQATEYGGNYPQALQQQQKITAGPQRPLVFLRRAVLITFAIE